MIVMILFSSFQIDPLDAAYQELKKDPSNLEAAVKVTIQVGINNLLEVYIHMSVDSML